MMEVKINRGEESLFLHQRQTPLTGEGKGTDRKGAGLAQNGLQVIGPGKTTERKKLLLLPPRKPVRGGGKGV